MMKKSTIAGKLIFCFASLLLLFSLAVGSVFSVLFARQTTRLHQHELEEKANSIAQTFGGFMSRGAGYGHGMGGSGMGGGMGEGGMGGYGAYLKFLDQIAMTDVWVMDQHSNLIVFAQGENSIHYRDLPPDAEEVVAQALAGQNAFSEGFSELLGKKSITVGAPIFGTSQEVLGVVLLHTPVDGIDTAVAAGLRLLGGSLILALMLAIVSAVPLAWHFTKPLRRMKDVAVAVAGGDYSAKTEIVQRDEIGELALTLDWMSEKLAQSARESERLAQLRRDFTANISHELRTPVTVLRGSLEALCDEVVSDPAMVKEYHLQMREDSIQLQRLVDDLLELSRLQNTDFAIETTRINLCEIVQDVARSIRRLAEKKQLELLVDCPDEPCDIRGDYGRLRQMLLIIADNAIKFSYEGTPLQLRLRCTEQAPILSVSDRGVVIPAQSLPLIFERFHKSKDANNKTGTGLGLAIARQIATRHDIQMHVESTEEATVFEMVFPSYFREDTP